MKITIVGTGYVGLVTGACLADMGNEVKCLDIDEEKIRRLREGIIPIYEPGLEGVVRRNVEAGRLTFTLDAAEAAQWGVVQMIAVGTPPDEDGSADLRHVIAAARSIGRHMPDYRVVVDKSTVPVGTGDKVEQAIAEELAVRGADALIIMTEWKEFRSPPFDEIRQRLKHPVIFDGRNLYEPPVVARHGIEYHSVGRPTA